MSNPWQVNILTLFPEMFPGPLGQSLAGKALAERMWTLETINIRDFAEDKHQTVDDRPFGGGAGMVMRPDIIANAIDSIETPGKILYMTPRGTPFTQESAAALASNSPVSILCGRYEGVDQRVIEAYNIEEISIGDFVLSGGEIAAITLIDACLRQISGVIGNPSVSGEESFGEGNYAHLLEYPHYTRPEEWRGRKVPDVLLTGHHANISAWRLEQAEQETKATRKDLWLKYQSDKNNT